MESVETGGTEAGQSALATWADATYQAAVELAETTLDLEVVAADDGDAPEAVAFVSLSSGKVALQIGIGSSKAGLVGLSKAMLMMEPDEELDDEELVDAIGEMANVIAGGVKTRLASSQTGLSIGLPLFVEGSVRHQKMIELCRRHAMVGGFPVTLSIARQIGR